MAISKLLVASIAIALVFLGVRSDASNKGESADVSGSTLRLEIEELRSKISALESSIEDRIREIENKDASIAQLNTGIQEKLSRITSLESEIQSLQKKDAADAKKMAGKAGARVEELEKQIAKLRSEIEVQSKKRDALGIRASEAEKKIHELNLRLESLQRTNEEQKLLIRKTQHALELAEEELMRAQLEATSKLKDFTKVHEAWLPPWLATHLCHLQHLAVSHWNKHAKPMLAFLWYKVSEKLGQVQKWAEPHFNSAKTEWIPAAKEHLTIFKSNGELYLQKASAKTSELYKASKRTITPQFAKLQEVAYPYLQEARKFSKPYIDQLVVVTKPHVEKLQLVLTPYTKHVARTYRKSIRRARTYHRQVQENIHEQLKKHELTKPHASKELAWFMASAFLSLPIFFLYKVLAAVLCTKKPRRPRRTAHKSHTHKRAKHRHAEK